MSDPRNTMNVLQKLARLAQEDDDLRPLLMPILREAAGTPDWAEGKKWQKAGAEPHPEGADVESNDVYEHTVDHGYEQPLSGGHDIMKRLQDRLLIEQGRPPREPNPRLAATAGLQQKLIKVLAGPQGREAVRQVVAAFAQETGKTIVVNAAVDDILHYAVAVALDPPKLGALIAKHTAPDPS